MTNSSNAEILLLVPIRFFHISLVQATTGKVQKDLQMQMRHGVEPLFPRLGVASGERKRYLSVVETFAVQDVDLVARIARDVGFGQFRLVSYLYPGFVGM